MIRTIPQYLLLTEAFPAGSGADGGRWQFVLEQTDGPHRIEAADDERGMGLERLHLLSVVRGLEALDRTASVTLVTASRQIARAIRHGLAEWRESDWCWEFFDEMTPVKNGDLWRRVDQALSIHEVSCRLWQPDWILKSDRFASPAPVSFQPRQRFRRAVRQFSDAVAGHVNRLTRVGYAANL
jgi:ribonuclease HI